MNTAFFRKFSKKTLHIVLAFVLVFATFFGVLAAPVYAATSSTVASELGKYFPIVTYAMPLSGASTVYSYSDSSLSTITKGYWISCWKDQIVLTAISSNGKAVKVTYPSSSAPGGYRTRWFKTEDILGMSTVSVGRGTAKVKIDIYRMNGPSSLTPFGSISKGDKTSYLGYRIMNSYTCYVAVYPITSGTYNKVSRVKYKMGLFLVSNNNNNNTESAVRARLDGIMNGSVKYDSKTVMTRDSKFTGTRSSEQCKGYAKNVFYLCFKITPGSTQSKPYNYLLNSTSGMTKVGSVTNMSNNSSKRDAIKNLFSSARAGDFVQIRRQHTGSHSAIVYSVSNTGVTFLEANTDGNNTVKLLTYTWGDLCSKNVAMTVYTASSYSLK